MVGAFDGCYLHTTNTPIQRGAQRLDGDGADVHVGACRCLQADRERKPGHMLIRCRDDGTVEGANREGGLVCGCGEKGRDFLGCFFFLKRVIEGGKQKNETWRGK